MALPAFFTPMRNDTCSRFGLHSLVQLMGSLSQTKSDTSSNLVCRPHDLQQHILPLYLNCLGLTFPRVTHPVKNRSAEDERTEGEKARRPLHTFCILTIQIKHSPAAVEAEPPFVISSDTEHADALRRRARQTGNPGLQRRHVISMDVLFLLNRLVCET